MQSCAAVSKTIDEPLVFSMASVARPTEIKEVMAFALEGEFVKARDLLLKIMGKYSLSGMDVIKQLQQCVWDIESTDNVKVNIIDACGEIEFRLVEGSDEFIQLEALLARIVLAKK